LMLRPIPRSFPGLWQFRRHIWTFFSRRLSRCWLAWSRLDRRFDRRGNIRRTLQQCAALKKQ
jgi:hypothetical protein